MPQIVQGIPLLLARCAGPLRPRYSHSVAIANVIVDPQQTCPKPDAREMRLRVDSSQSLMAANVADRMNRSHQLPHGKVADNATATRSTAFFCHTSGLALKYFKTIASAWTAVTSGGRQISLAPRVSLVPRTNPFAYP